MNSRICELIGALSRIAAYEPPESLRECSEDEWGLPYHECLEMAYENVLIEARSVLERLADQEGEALARINAGQTRQKLGKKKRGSRRK